MDTRPDPDALLAQVQAEEAQAKRGSLRIFFGYAAGVGKTFAMLEHAQRAKSQGREVVVGYVEPHARPETQALVKGLEVLTPRELEYRGVTLREFDVDAALARHPEVLLVDELAHTNAEGCRHAKRWQDVEELLAAGINVWTTLNVQHIESLNDVIGQITGIVVRETIPDRVFDVADELELVDVTPEDLLERLAAGKIYISDQAQRAIQKFFQKSNLAALRELSLRQAARRIHSDVESARREKAVTVPWATAERLLVCIGPSPTTARVIRTAKRMATALDAPWVAVSVDLTGDTQSGDAGQRIAQHFALAERLGAETVTIPGQSISGALIEFARSRNVTKIFIGKTNQPRWRKYLFGTVVDDVLEHSGDIDVYVIHGEEARGTAPTKAARSTHGRVGPYVTSALMIGISGLLTAAARWLRFADAEANSVMLFLAAVAFVAARYGRQPAIFASMLAVLTFDFFFVPPFYTFAVADTQYVVTFAVMLTIGLVIATQTSRLKAQFESTQRRERRTSALYELGKQLSSLSGSAFLVSAAAGKLAELTGGEVAVFLKNAAGDVELRYGEGTLLAGHPVSLPTAHWVASHDQIAGAATNTLPNAAGLFLPIIGSQGTHGAIAIRSTDGLRLLDPDDRRFLEASASQLALALERDQSMVDAAEARIQAEAEQARSSLLSSVSHDLKTPLAAIAGASSSLLAAAHLDEATQRQLLETVADEADRLHRLLENILQMSKLEAGAASPNRQWHVLEEIVGSALQRTERELKSHPVDLHLPLDLPLCFVDGLLFEQVLINLLENAARYTPANTPISISAALEYHTLRITVADRGPGLLAGSEDRIFDKFYRAARAADAGRGSGLGLAICRAIIQAHGGEILARNRPGGGAEFVIRLPHIKGAPEVVVE